MLLIWFSETNCDYKDVLRIDPYDKRCQQSTLQAYGLANQINAV